jgi:hypothetical protein
MVPSILLASMNDDTGVHESNGLYQLGSQRTSYIKLEQSPSACLSRFQKVHLCRRSNEAAMFAPRTLDLRALHFELI